MEVCSKYSEKKIRRKTHLLRYQSIFERYIKLDYGDT